jgi:hypothetical protein
MKINALASQFTAKWGGVGSSCSNQKMGFSKSSYLYLEAALKHPPEITKQLGTIYYWDC